MIAWFLVFCFIRETKQLTLEEIDRTYSPRSPIQKKLDMLTQRAPTEVFSVPTSKFIGYELKVWLPYFCKRHVLRKKIEKPPPIIEKEGQVTTM